MGEPVKHFWRHVHPATASLVEQHKAFGESNRAVLARVVAWLDRELSDGRAWLAGDVFSMADITGVTIIDFAKLIGLAPLGDKGLGREHVRAWHARVTARPAFATQSTTGPSL